MDAALALEMNAGDGGFELLEPGLAAQLVGCARGPSTVTVPARADSPLRAGDVGVLEERIDVEAGEVEAWPGSGSRR